MRFVYGKQDWKTFERGEENCYLMTNGLGGFSSLSLIGSCSRGDHAVFMACTHSPNHRYNMIHRLEETLVLGAQCPGMQHSGAQCPGAQRVYLSSQDFQMHEKREQGYLCQSRFCFEDYPRWTYLVEGVEVVRTIVLEQGKNTLGISYQIRNRSEGEATLTVVPHLQFVPKGARPEYGERFTMTDEAISNDPAMIHQTGGAVTSNGLTMYYRTNGVCRQVEQRFCDTLYYAADVEDGKMTLGRSVVTHEIVFSVGAGGADTLEIIYSMEPLEAEKDVCVQQIINHVSAYRQTLRERAGYRDGVADQLAVSADQFISHRASTNGKTILAGYPFFADWGRDTMIALTGCCLSTGQFETAESILRTFMAYCSRGLMPNLFPEGDNAPLYNTVDGALLFIIAVYEYYMRVVKNRYADAQGHYRAEEAAEELCREAGSHTEEASDFIAGGMDLLGFIREAYPVMKEIVNWYRKGTDFHIYMDRDGLIHAGGDLEQVTWMDVRVENILPTPRHGKPVEINAYWYNTLRILDFFGQLLGEDTVLEELPRNQELPGAWSEDLPAHRRDAPQVQVYGRISCRELAEIVKKSFGEQFWNEEKDCLKDVISGTEADEQIRCNQIWAVSLPFSLMIPAREKAVVETVFRKLYTPYGLRTLAPEDAQFRAFYGGAQLDRDLAYHQGTVWPFPMGAYYLAYLKVHQYSPEAKAYVREQLTDMEAALREGCVGQLAEIYDGGNPVSGKGCFAQAWSVGEILRVYDALRE